MVVAFGGQVGDRPEPLGQPAEGEVRLLRDGEPGRVLLRGFLKLGFLQARRRERRPQARS